MFTTAKNRFKIATCKACSLKYSYLHSGGIYCSNKCQKEFEYQQSIANWELKSPGKPAIKRWLAETFGNCCSVCKIVDWQEQPLTLELEHKDGNSDNNSKENLCLLCPNCHSQTPTFKAKNKGNGREWRLNNHHARKKLALAGELM